MLKAETIRQPRRLVRQRGNGPTTHYSTILLTCSRLIWKLQPKSRSERPASVQTSVCVEQPNNHPNGNASAWVQERRANGREGKKRGCRVVTHHINKVQRGLITRTSICQAGRPYVSFLHGGLFVSCDFLQLPVMNTGLCIPD